jgi:hypothetical protein
MRRSIGIRLLCLSLLLLVAAPLAACGGSQDHKSGAPGSKGNPLVANAEAEEQAKGRVNEAAAAPTPAPGYQRLLEKQTKRPRSGFTPCNLVTPRQAQSILGAPIQAPLEAPQGPTCIYRTRSGSGFVTVSVQTLDLAAIRHAMREPRRIAVSGHRAYCGVYGQPMLYTALPGGRVLSVGARCRVARAFATRAVARLG